MKKYYTYTNKGQSPNQHSVKILRKEQLLHEVKLKYDTDKYDLYRVIEESQTQKTYYEKIAAVDEFEYKEFE